MKTALPQASLHIKPLLERFQKAVLASHENDLLGIVLFGSYARGDFHPDSDIDLLLLFDDTFKYLKKDDPIFDIVADYMGDKQALIAPLATQQTAFDQWQTPLYLNVKKEGIVLWKK